MSAMQSLIDIAWEKNNDLARATDVFVKARRGLEHALEEQDIAIRALAAVNPDHSHLDRGNNLVLAAVKALAADVENTKEGS